ncbi:MAG TPA: cytochrome d ubiquinol oxidase subunit II [Terriglobales bacterium]|nr:cytochrome d ubiquinol oxidase subunit II [Terriglobales bacterium]
MGAWDFLRSIWFLLIGILLAGYSLLDGFDLGVGVLLPFLAKDGGERTALVRSIGPVWDGNEVWLLTGGGALFAAFPQAYATVFSGFYLALMPVLFSLILRAVSLEFRAHDARRKKLWEAVFVGASFLPALLFGVALGNVVGGVPLDARMEYAGSFFTLLRPLPLVFGLLGLAAFLLHGATWAALKTEGALQARARRTARAMAAATGILHLLAFAAVCVYLPSALDRLPSWAFAALVPLSLGLLLRALAAGRDDRAFIFSCAAFLGLWGTVGAVHYPNLVRATEPSLSLTVTSASSSALTLKVMLMIALVGMPFVIWSTVHAYRVFKGKVRTDEDGY